MDERELFASWSLFALSVNYSAVFSPMVLRISALLFPSTPWCFSPSQYCRAEKAEATREEDSIFLGHSVRTGGPVFNALSSRGTGGRTPTAEGHEHENVHHLLRNYYRLNTLLLLVSSISFSKNVRGDGNLCWKEELQIGWCLSAE